jgi:2-(1,2-epoxy-1,2-dihydrophenyl)acetyl-CoA isomerase
VTDEGSGAVRSSRTHDVLRIVMDRTDRRNAMSAAMVATLIGALEEAAVDDGLRAVIVEGAGGDFCAGVDWVSSNASGERPRAGQLARRIPLQAHRVIQLLQDIQLPVICAVQGWAVGFGLGMALAADFTIATRSARLWAPFTQRGFTPDSGSTWLLPRLVGVARAKELLLLGRKISGAEAADMGLIHRAVDDADLEPCVSALVEELAGGPTVALGLGKTLINAAAQRTLPEALLDESVALEIACRTRDFREGLSAFVERRDPEFRGR